jgi:Ca-activated chloride channel homolog
MKIISQSSGILLFIAMMSLWSSAQQDSPTITFKSNVSLVLVDTTVRDQKGRVVSGLQKTNFHVLEDGVEQSIRVFSESQLPLAIAIVVDKSGSMRNVFADLRDSAVRAFSALHPQDRIALFAFDRRVERLTDLTSDHEEVARAFEQLDAGGGTDILDAVYEASRYLKLAAPKERRAIVLISDNISFRFFNRRHEDEIVNTALEFETDIHSIQVRQAFGFGLTGPIIPIPGTRLERVSISEITKNTGGEITHSGGGSTGKTLAEVLDRIRKRYALGYYASTNSKPGQFHRLQVRVADNQGKQLKDYSVSARSGYYTSK